jgi:hypothetical protein
MKPAASTDVAPVAPAEAEDRPPLSRFEGHCLCRRTRECEEALQLAVLGIARALEGRCPDDNLAEIAEHLAEAERHVEVARRLASRWSA